MNTARGIADQWPHWRGELSIFRVTIALLWHILAACATIAYGRLEFFIFILTTYITLQFGLVLGYHRLLSHRCFATHTWFRRSLSLIGTLAMQNGPISWVAMHRRHHQTAEQEFDPHSPRHGLLWAHFFWTFFEHPKLSRSDERALIAQDLQGDSFIRFCEEHFILLNAALTAGVFLAGVGVGGLWRGFSFLVWVICVRTVCLWHITFLVNSVGHTIGYRNFDTPDGSRNLGLFGLLAMGDGWHNNHHAFPSCAAHGRRWFEVDPTYQLIRILELLGLAWNVRHPTPASKPKSSSTEILGQ